MTRFFRRILPWLLLLSLLGSGEEPKDAQQREYTVPLTGVKAALQNMGAYTGNRLPSLEGFVKLDSLKPEQYQKPYYEYQIDLVPSAPDRTVVRVKANVSAWYEASETQAAGYRNLISNGRLETDLLDRLSSYLEDRSADPAELQTKIDSIHAQRLEAEQRVAELQAQLDHPASSTVPAEFVSPVKPHVAIMSAPSPGSRVILQPQADDEFQVIERRDQWLHVALEGDQSGWIKLSEVQSASQTGSAAAALNGADPGRFTIIREMSTDFSGDWTRLKGKRVLYVWARPEASSLIDVIAEKKLQFAQSVFRDRYRQATHSSADAVAGVVVIFLDQSGGVAAATLDDIRLWDEGTLSQTAFLRKCSFDPGSAFASPQPKPN